MMKRYISETLAARIAASHSAVIPIWVAMGHMIKESALRIDDVETSAGFLELGLMQLDARGLHDRGLIRGSGLPGSMTPTEIEHFLEPELNISLGASMYARYRQAVAREYPGLDDEAAWSLAYLRFSAGGGRIDEWLSQIRGKGSLTYSDMVSEIAKRAQAVRGRSGAGNLAYHTLLRLGGFRICGARWFT